MVARKWRGRHLNVGSAACIWRDWYRRYLIKLKARRGSWRERTYGIRQKQVSERNAHGVTYQSLAVAGVSVTTSSALGKRGDSNGAGYRGHGGISMARIRHPYAGLLNVAPIRRGLLAP